MDEAIELPGVGGGIGFAVGGEVFVFIKAALFYSNKSSTDIILRHYPNTERYTAQHCRMGL